jgi:hypothetical protein
MKDWLLLKAYKIMLAVGIIPQTEAFKATWERRADGQCYVKTLALCVICALSSGCVMIVNYAPSAARASLYAHDQAASNMVVNQEIPVTAQLAEDLTGTIGANLKGN